MTDEFVAGTSESHVRALVRQMFDGPVIGAVEEFGNVDIRPTLKHGPPPHRAWVVEEHDLISGVEKRVNQAGFKGFYPVSRKLSE